MKKLILVGIIAVAVLFAGSVFAGTLNPGDKTSCNNSKSITLEAKGMSSKGDRGNANVVVWKSSNFTTIPISLGPTDENGFAGERHIGLANHQSMGRSKFVLTHQTNFSRGDSIGDISGEVRITNTGTVPVSVSCN